MIVPLASLRRRVYLTLNKGDRLRRAFFPDALHTPPNFQQVVLLIMHPCPERSDVFNILTSVLAVVGHLECVDIDIDIGMCIEQLQVMKVAVTAQEYPSVCIGIDSDTGSDIDIDDGIDSGRNVHRY